MKNNKARLLGQYLMEASDAYPDNFLEMYFDFSTGRELERTEGDDTFALAIGREIRSLYDDNATDKNNREAFRRALLAAALDLAKCAEAFEVKS